MKNSIIKVTVAVLIAALIGTGTFFLGRYTSEQELAARQQLMQVISRSELDGLGEISGTIYVTGHRSPDTDTVCCAIAVAELMKKLGYDAQPVVLGEINRETEFILRSAGVETPPLLDSASGKNMILVDHSDVLQSAEGIEQANIIEIIDHHNDGTVTTANQMVYDSRPLGATATIVWTRYRNYGIELDRTTAKLLLGAVLSDTMNLIAVTTTNADRAAVKELSRIAGVEDVKAFYTDMYKALISYDGMTDDEIYRHDMKQYESGSVKFTVGVVEVYDKESAVDMAARMKAVMPTVRDSLGVDTAFAMVSIFHDDQSVTYLVPADEKSETAVKTAFGDKAEFDGTSYILEPSISRKKIFIPGISEVLK